VAVAHRESTGDPGESHAGGDERSLRLRGDPRDRPTGVARCATAAGCCAAASGLRSRLPPGAARALPIRLASIRGGRCGAANGRLGGPAALSFGVSLSCGGGLLGGCLTLGSGLRGHWISVSLRWY